MSDSSAKILVVDDDVKLLDLLVDTLTAIGYESVGAEGGEQALAYLSTGEFGLVITDIKMPGMDGVTLLNKIRELYPKLPVMFITGVASPEIIGQASPNGFLAKPFRINRIEEMIENALKGRPEVVAGRIKRVMVLDDDATFREMLTDALQYHNYFPLAVATGEEALDQLEQEEVDAVVADIKMPGLDGITLLKKIKDAYPEMPVILITAYWSEADIQDNSVTAAADGFLRKPFHVEKIIELLDRIAPAAVDDQ